MLGNGLRLCEFVPYLNNFNSFPLINIQILNCLREYCTGYVKRLSFSGRAYAAAFNAIMVLISTVDDDNYHGGRLTKLLKGIARDGM